MENTAAVCGCDKVRMFDFPDGFYKQWKTTLSNDTVEKTTAFCVVYVYNDSDAIPREFKNLFYVDDQIVKDTLSIDPLPYFYGLKYLTYYKSGHRIEAGTALKKLNECVQTGKLYHLKSAVTLCECLNIEDSQVFA